MDMKRINLDSEFVEGLLSPHILPFLPDVKVFHMRIKH
jgi:hypothetical protein